MLLSIQQRYILDLLRQLKCLRREQIDHLVRRQFPRRDGRELAPGAVEAMLRQLRYCTNDVLLEDGFVRLLSAKPDTRCMEAVDVMLELTDGRARGISKGREPRALLPTEVEGERLRLLTVADLDGTLPQTLSDMPRQRLERIVWISGSGKADGQLVLPPKHFFAARNEDGSHRFYSGEEP